jgi:hypothetical protein
MNEQRQHESDQDPEPTKHADAQRITEDEAQRVPTSEQDQPADPPSKSTDEMD